MASAAGDSAAYGGVGGAFRRKRNRSHQSTPYDRPATAIRSSQRNDSGGWLSKIVDPASKLITAGAHKLFSSVFRKRLLPPPSLPQQSADERQEPRDGHPEAATAGGSSGLHDESRIPVTSSQANGVTELESILKQKTFTRSEIDRLTALLQSRVPNATPRTGEERAGLNSQTEVVCAGEHLDGSLHKIGTTHSGSPTDMTPALISKVNEDGIASPAELAKAYMGSRPTNVSPLMLGSRTRLIKEEAPVSNALSHLRTPGVSLVQKPVSGSGFLENNSMFLRSRCRPAIYRVTPSPYSRDQPVGALKGFGSRVDARDGGPSSSSQKALKRRHSVLENDIGSVGPIRRTRQKSNLRGLGLPSSSTLPLTKGNASEAGETSSAAQTRHDYSSLKTPVNMKEKCVPMRISSKSIEMGERILQQLEKLTPPGEKLSGKKPAAQGVSISNMEMTPAMLHGKARRSLETVGSLKLLENVQDGGKDVGVDTAADKVRTSSEKQDMGLGESKNKITMSDLKKGAAKVSSISPAEINKNISLMGSKSGVDVPKRSRAFQMSAHEDFLDLDDDVHSNGFASSSMNGDKETVDKSGLQSTITLGQENQVDAGKTEVAYASPEVNPPNSLFKKSAHSESSFPVYASAEKGNNSSSLPAAPGSSVFGSAAEPNVALSTISESNNAAFSSPTVSFGNNGTAKASPASLFASSPVQESSFVKDVKSHSSSSVDGFYTPTMQSAKILPGFDDKSTEEDVDTHKKSKSNSPFPVSGPSMGTSSFEMPRTSPAPKNGLFSFSTSTSSPASSPALLLNQSEPNGIGGTAVAANTFTTTSVGVSTSGSESDKAAAAAPFGANNGSLTNSTSSPLSFSSPAVKEGTSSAASTFGFSAVATDSVPKSQEPVGNNPANLTSSSAANTGFQFGASTTTNMFSSDPASSQDTSGKTIFGNLPTSTASTESTPQQPFSSPAFPSVGSSGSASLTSVSPIFGTSTPASGSGFAFGLSSSTSSSAVAASAQSGSTGIFGSSWKGPDSSGNQSSGLAFGASSSSSASAPASNSPSIFNFGASSSVSAPASNSSPGLSFGGASSSAQTNNTSSGFSFGLNSSPLVPAASSGSAPVFAFGASAATPPSTSSSSPFQFGVSSSTTQPSSTSMFNSASPSPSPVFGFGAPPSSAVVTPPPTSQPVFGNGGSVFPFGSMASQPGSNNDQMTMEDSMAEDSSNTPPQAAAAPVFGQPPAFGQQQQQPSGGFVFGAPPQPQPAGANPFQFGGGQQQQAQQVGAPQNSVFGSAPGGGGSFELGAGGSFSLGSGGGNDKSSRRMVRVNRKHRKK